MFLEQLEVAVITGRKIGRDHRDLIRESPEPVAMGADQFKYIRVLFVRHDAAPGGELIGKTDKAKSRIEIQAGVHTELGQRIGNIGHGLRNNSFRLPSSRPPHNSEL